MSNIIVKVRYQNCKNVKEGVSSWGKYASKKEGADGHSINDDSSYYDYISKQFKVETNSHDNDISYLWSKNGDVSLEEVLNNPNENSGYIWDMVISLRPEFCIETGLTHKQSFYELTKTIMPKFLNDAGLSTIDTKWLSALHLNTKNPHLHVCIYQTKQTKATSKLDKNAIKKMKSNISSFLMDYKNFYKDRDNYFLGLTSKIREENFTNVMKQNFFTDSERKTLNSKLLKFYDQLTGSGRLQYNAKNMQHLRKNINEIIEYILKHSSIKYDYEEYYNLLVNHQKELKRMYGETKNNNYLDNQIERLYSKIGNDILNEFKIYDSEPFIENQRKFLFDKIFDVKFKSYAKTEKSIIKAGEGLYRLGKLTGLDDYNMIKLFGNWINKSGYNQSPSYFIDKYKEKKYLDLTKEEFYSIIKKLGYDNERYFKYKNKHFYQNVGYRKLYYQAKQYLYYALEEERKEQIDKEEYFEI
ncbi:MAG: relaxase MobL [Clostridia bacterium]|nr:relaxase MobL [Clostridia bacterium]